MVGLARKISKQGQYDVGFPIMVVMCLANLLALCRQIDSAAASTQGGHWTVVAHLDLC